MEPLLGFIATKTPTLFSRHWEDTSKSVRSDEGTEARLSYLLTAVAGGFPRTLVRNETQRHSAALKIAGQNPISLLPLDGFDPAVSPFQLHPVFGVASSRVPPGNAMSCFIAFGDKSWDNFKNGGADE